MGCDIHCFVEKQDETGKWSKIGGFVSDYYEPEGYFSGERYKNADSPIADRNYFLFALLAGVRQSGNEIQPISLPKGLPDDVSDEVRQENDEWGSDGHSHSWLTVRELVDSFNGSFECEGVVDIRQYREFKENGKPRSWCASSGPVTCCTNAEIDQIISWGWDQNPAMKDMIRGYCTVVRWTYSVADILSGFMEKTLPQLVERCERDDKSDVRIVFWFDN